MLPAFHNEPLTDFTKSENVEAFRAALDRVKADIGQTYPLVIGGQRISADSTFTSINPSRPAEVLGQFVSGTKEHADKALQAAEAAFKTWQYVPAAERARTLLRAAAEMRRRKHEFSATMVLEVGKSWVEADADTAEAIDFLEYYARQAVRIADVSHMLAPNPPEQLSLTNIPLGVGVIIPPWNFALAIPTGMVAAAIVSGNTVIFKPASQSPWIAYKLAELLWQSGVPGGVLNFLTGPGSTTGGYLVAHPRIRFVGFTGSKEVGVWIHETAAKVQPGQIWLKRTILEMGGKDAIVVDETANLEQAAQGIVVSAFGYQGQKCSAASRAIIVDAVYDQVVNRVVELAEQITVGVTDYPESWMGPVIDAKALKTMMDYVEIGTQEGKLLTGGQTIDTPEGGYFLQPTIFGDVPPEGRLAQEEIFGPVLAVIRAADYEHALAIANNTEFGLTGGVYSTDHARLEQARREFHVGNLYFNRKCTGALVGVHPFGGFNMSGTDSKAGGPDYLLLFTQQKTVAEKL